MERIRLTLVEWACMIFLNVISKQTIIKIKKRERKQGSLENEYRDIQEVKRKDIEFEGLCFRHL